jgi:hypothetical protein
MTDRILIGPNITSTANTHKRGLRAHRARVTPLKPAVASLAGFPAGLGFSLALLLFSPSFNQEHLPRRRAKASRYAE